MRRNKLPGRIIAGSAAIALLGAGFLGAPAMADDDPLDNEETQTQVADDADEAGDADAAQDTEGTEDGADGGDSVDGEDAGEAGEGEEGTGEDAGIADDASTEEGADPDGEEDPALSITPFQMVTDGDIFISEIHYDNAGVDTGEAIEVQAPVGTDLTGWQIVLYNGEKADAVTYGELHTLDGLVDDSGVVVLDYPINGLQNGPRDGMALVDPSGEVIELLSYNGVFTAGEGPAEGMTSTDIGVMQPSNTPIGLSLQRLDGEWIGPVPSSFGEINTPYVEPDFEFAEQIDDTHTISQVQGTGSATPLNGEIVTVTGVVTSKYATGGLRGYFIQTEGTGAAAEQTASDGIFVFSEDTAAHVEIGNLVQVTGRAGEFSNQTQISVAVDDVALIAEESENPPVPVADFAFPSTDEEREVYEGMLIAPDNNFVVSDLYELGGFGSAAYGTIGMGYGGVIVQETEIAAPGTPEFEAAEADIAARQIMLDDGQSAQTTANDEVPYLTGNPDLRVGATLEFEQPVVLGYGFNAWRFQPTEPVTGAVDWLNVISGGRSDAPVPNVAGDLTLAAFNVLNYFTSLGEDEDGCTAYTDRDGEPLTGNFCDVRGAYTPASLERQEAKIVAAINALDADVVALQEVENSAKLGLENDEQALSDLVDALNAAAGSEKWAYVENPSQMPPIGDQDYIRNAFIYQPATVSVDSESVVLIGDPAFHNAREPLAQVFTSVDNPDYSFVAAVNHLKSKSGSNCPIQGCFEDDRIAQAEALADFVADVADDAEVEDIFLLGDFNSYSAEPPIAALETAGYTSLNNTGKYSYAYNGKVGSLDHIMANESAAASVIDVDLWEINANESVLAEYSRYNYYASSHFEAGTPFRSSDHNPMIVGIDVPSDTVVIDLLSINDFHGRIAADGQSAGAAVMACVVDGFREANPNTLFVSAGDSIGASTFPSAVAQDQPTLDVLIAMGLDVSTFGNHEFDQGQADMDDRVIPYTEDHFPFISANIYSRTTGERAYKPYHLVEVEGITVGFIGAITEDMESLVAKDRVADLEWRSIRSEVNAVAEELTDGDVSNGEADVLVVIVHDGAPGVDAASITEATPYGDLVHNAHPRVAAVISGHTHLPYVHEIDGVTAIMSAQYGEMMGHLVIEVDKNTGEASVTTAENIDLVDADGVPLCEGDPAIQAIVDDALAEASILGNVPIGEITDDFLRSTQPEGGENRGGESTIGNWVSDVYAWAATQNDFAVDIAFMNPGGIRTDMLYAGVAGDDVNTDGVVTYEEAALVQPFANTITHKEYTGAQIKQILEEQWQPDGASRPFLKLGISEGFQYTYDPQAPRNERVTGMWLNGVEIDLEESYGVATNSFLMGGGDSFFTFAENGLPADTGWVDLAATVEYFKAQDGPVSPDYSQRAIGVTWLSDADAEYGAGDEVELSTSSWTFTGDADKTAQEIVVTLNGEEVGNFPVDITAVEGSDEAGTAEILFTIPQGLITEDGVAVLQLTDEMGTVFELPLNVVADSGAQPGTVVVDLLSINDFHGRIAADGQSAGAAVMACVVDGFRAENPNTLFVSGGDNIGATTFASAVAQDQPTLDVLIAMGLDVSTFGNHEFDQGQADMDDRVIPYTEDHFPFISANIYSRTTGERVYDAYHLETVEGVTFGFIGAITEDLPTLVSPDRIADLDIRSMSEEVNAVAEQLRDGDPSNGEADVLVVVVHDGAPGVDAASIAEGTPYGDLVHNSHPDISAIVSGHTHLPYVHEIDGVTAIMSAQYGEMMGHLVFEYDVATGEVAVTTAENIDLVDADGVPLCEGDPAIQAIVDDALDQASVLGNVPIGEITDDFLRSTQPEGGENRGGESTIGNWVSDVYAWAATQNGYGVDIAFMNPGGIRTDMLYAGVPGDDVNTDGVITYEEAAMVQPFANTVEFKEFTGAQIKQILEEQWQPEGSSRPFLKLGVSEGFQYTYDPEAASGERITGIWLNGVALDLAATYGVATNSFLMAGGDSFFTFAENGSATDTGWVDLAATVEYFKAQDGPISPDYSQRAIGVTWVSDPEATYGAGDVVEFNTTSWTFTSDADKTAQEVAVVIDGEVIGTFPVDVTAVENSDEAGTALIRFELPAGLITEDGTISMLLVDGVGTLFELPLNVTADATDPVDPDPSDPTPTDPTKPGGPSLPGTGVDPVVWLVLVALLLGGGASLVYFQRRQRAEIGDDPSNE